MECIRRDCRSLVLPDLEYVELLHVVLRLGVDDDLFSQGSFEVGDKVVFLTMQEFSHLRVRPNGHPLAENIP
jgi:hypothetical protein